MQDALALPERRFVLPVLSLSVVLLVVLNSGTTLSVWIALFLRPFMHGVSLVKIDFLLIFILLAGLMVLCGLVVRKRRTLTILLWTALGSTALSGIMAMATFLRLAARLHLPFGKYAYFFSEGYNSVNQFAHLHVTKTGLYHLVSLLGQPQIADHVDTGRPFAGYIDPAVSLSILAAAALCFAALLIASGTVVRSWRGPRQAVALVVYSMAASHTVKCLLDGGPLAYDFLPSVMTVCLMFLHAGGTDLWSAMRRQWLRILMVAILFLAFTYPFSSDVAVIIQPQQYAFFFGIYFLLVGVLVYDVKRRLVLGLAALPFMIWCGVYYYSHTVPDVRALNQIVSERDRVFVRVPARSTGAVFTGAVDEVTAAVQGRTILDVYRMEGDSPLRNRTVIVKRGDDANYAGFIFALRVLKSDSLLTFAPTESMTIRGLTTAGETTDSMLVLRVDFDPDRFPSLWSAASTIIDENNRFAVLYYLDDYFASRGLRDYVLIPMYYEERA